MNTSKLFSDEAGAVLERATTAGGGLHKNMLLYFAHADFEEGRLKYDKVHQIYNKFIDIQDIDPSLVSTFRLIIVIIIFSITYVIKSQAYVQYMKFTRRAEGIKSARTVFKRAREDPRYDFLKFSIQIEVIKFLIIKTVDHAIMCMWQPR